MSILTRFRTKQNVQVKELRVDIRTNSFNNISKTFPKPNYQISKAMKNFRLHFEAQQNRKKIMFNAIFNDCLMDSVL